VFIYDRQVKPSVVLESMVQCKAKKSSALQSCVAFIVSDQTVTSDSVGTNVDQSVSIEHRRRCLLMNGTAVWAELVTARTWLSYKVLVRALVAHKFSSA
jgi:hypothetical protein